ncbi:hypothetical protein ACOMHN_024804 [Nucella lapillus]
MHIAIATSVISLDQQVAVDEVVLEEVQQLATPGATSEQSLTSSGVFMADWSVVQTSWHFNDDVSPLVDYQWALGTSEGGVQLQGFRSVGRRQHASLSGLSVTHGSSLHVTVLARNAAGMTSVAYSLPLTVDMTPPDIVDLWDGPSGEEVDFQTSQVVSARWTVSDAESAAGACQWAIGTTPGRGDIQSFQLATPTTTSSDGYSVSSDVTAALTSFSLPVTLYVSVRCYNRAGLPARGATDGVTIMSSGQGGQSSTLRLLPDSRTPYPVLEECRAYRDNLRVRWGNVVSQIPLAGYQITRSSASGQDVSQTPALPYLLEGAHLNLTHTLMTSDSNYTVTVDPVDIFGTVTSGPARTTYVMPAAPAVQANQTVTASVSGSDLTLTWSDLFLSVLDLNYEVTAGSVVGGGDILLFEPTLEAEVVISLQHAQMSTFNMSLVVTAIDACGQYAIHTQDIGPTYLSLLADSTALHSIAEASTTAAAAGDAAAAAAAAAAALAVEPLSDRTVSFCRSMPLAPLQQQQHSTPRTASVMSSSNGGAAAIERGQKQEPLPPVVPRYAALLQSSRSVTAVPGARVTGGLPAVPHSQQGILRPQGFESRGTSIRPNTQNLARLGRPIAQWTHIPDPGEVAEAVQKQKEAAAAVDIQRLFRGYVARNVYRKLLKEERGEMEDKQRAAMEIQRAYRNHVRKNRVIENRPYNPKLLQWAHNYCLTLTTREGHRQVKLGHRSEKFASNFSTAHSKMSVIGPHVNIYEIYHPKRTGPTKKELNTAAIVIQRHTRGWLVRRRFEQLHRKAAWYGSTFPKMVKEYKTLLTKIQRQHGVEQTKTPFSTKDMNDYIDIRRRHSPSRHARGLKKQEIMDRVFYIYTPKATGLQGTRQSTWLNPIIDGVEARRLLGSEFVEDAPLEVCAQLVISTMRERHEKDRAVQRARKEKEAAELRERLGIPHPKDSDDEEEEGERMRRMMKRMRRVTLAEPSTVKDSRRSSVQNNKSEERRLSKDGEGRRLKEEDSVRMGRGED